MPKFAVVRIPRRKLLGLAIEVTLGKYRVLARFVDEESAHLFMDSGDEMAPGPSEGYV